MLATKQWFIWPLFLTNNSPVRWIFIESLRRNNVKFCWLLSLKNVIVLLFRWILYRKDPMYLIIDIIAVEKVINTLDSWKVGQLHLFYPLNHFLDTRSCKICKKPCKTLHMRDTSGVKSYLTSGFSLTVLRIPCISENCNDFLILVCSRLRLYLRIPSKLQDAQHCRVLIENYQLSCPLKLSEKSFVKR